MKPAIAIARDILFHLSSNTTSVNPQDPKGTSTDYLIWMCKEIIASTDWEVDKAHRWIGYIQGVMVSRGITGLDVERSRVRDIPDEEVKKQS